MLTLIWPWFLPALVLPLLVRLLPSVAQHYDPVYIPSLPHVHNLPPEQSHWRFYCSLAAWVMLCLALCRPQWLGDPVPLEQPHRDLMLAIDLSDSMRTIDMLEQGKAVNRLSIVKSRLNQFIEARAGDRMGLILFADHAYLMAPLTSDWKTLTQFVDELDFGLAGHLTAMGEGIGLALKRFAMQNSKEKLMVLLSDGRDTVETIPPLAAAELAHKKGMKIYTIGLGAEIALEDELGNNSNPSADLDETTLMQIATITGGRYYRARDPDALAAIYQEINQLEPKERGQRFLQPKHELYVWPLGLAILFYLAGHFSLLRRRRHD